MNIKINQEQFPTSVMITYINIHKLSFTFQYGKYDINDCSSIVYIQPVGRERNLVYNYFSYCLALSLNHTHPSTHAHNLILPLFYYSMSTVQHLTLNYYIYYICMSIIYSISLYLLV